jgi:hypothetical protein
LTKPVVVKVRNRVFHLRLSGKVEVPVGAPKASGIAVVSIRGKALKLCWKFSALTNVVHPLVAYIHAGTAGTSGRVVLPLGGKFNRRGCIGATSNLLATIEKQPATYYVNVHNAKYPGGAVRGQL